MHIFSKWKRTKALLLDPQVASYVLPIRKFTKDNLLDSLTRQRLVYVKPVSGTYGHGVMRVEQLAGDNGGSDYSYQSGTKIRRFRSFDALHASILKHKRKRPYIIQKGIELLTYKKRRFDIRVMVQLSPEGKLRTTGVIARLGHPKRIVTNYHSGATLKDADTLLKPHLSPDERYRLMERIKQVGFQAAAQLHKVYPKVREIGVDIGIDQDYQPWIIEVNTRPDPFIFRKLKDPGIYRRVLRYYRRNQRRDLADRSDSKRTGKSAGRRKVRGRAKSGVR